MFQLILNTVSKMLGISPPCILLQWSPLDELYCDCMTLVVKGTYFQTNSRIYQQHHPQWLIKTDT